MSSDERDDEPDEREEPEERMRPEEEDFVASDQVNISTFHVGDAEYTVISMPRLALEDLAKVTEAEREVVALTLEGMSNAEIAKERAVSERTVANQLSSVYRKLGVNSRAELVAWLLDQA